MDKREEDELLTVSESFLRRLYDENARLLVENGRLKGENAALLADAKLRSIGWEGAEKRLDDLRASLEPVVEAVEKATAGQWCHRQSSQRGSGDGELCDWIGDAFANHHKIICGRGSFYGGTADYAAVVASINWLRGPARDFIRGERGHG